MVFKNTFNNIYELEMSRDIYQPCTSIANDLPRVTNIIYRKL